MKFRFNNNKILLSRIGPISNQYQDNDSAPARRGIWCFPWPYFDLYFAWHKHDDYLPDKLKDSWFKNNYIYLSEEQRTSFSIQKDKYLQENKSQIKKAMRVRQFWHEGEFWSRLAPKYIKDTSHDWYLWNNTREWARLANSTLKVNMKWWTGATSYIEMKTGLDHLELFVTL